MKLPAFLCVAASGVFAASVVVAQDNAVQLPQASPPAQAQTGRAHYVQYGCAQCHAYDGQGGLAGPRLGPGSLPYEVFENYVRFPSGRMPAYAPDQLSSDKVKRMHEYLSAQAAPPPVSGIPLLAERDRAIGTKR